MLETGMILQERYHTVRKLGGGGMGTVYLAEDRRLPGRKCALKEMIPQDLPAADRNWAIQAFQMEAQMLANLNHPGLTRVTDFFGEKGNWYLVMDFVPGETLEDRVARYPDHKLPIREMLHIVEQLCNVLNYLHGRNPPVIFRDLKPSNVMITPQQDIKLIDFGIARFFKTGQTSDTTNLGTPGYAAPEQYGGAGQSDARTDIYSLGVLIHHMVTGYDPSKAQSPFPLPDPRSIMPTIPPHLAQVISRATQLQPKLRFGSVAELQHVMFVQTNTPVPRDRSTYTATQIKQDGNQISPTKTQVMPGEPDHPAELPQNTAQYPVSSGRGYTQIQTPQGGFTPHTQQDSTPSTMTPWPSDASSPVSYPQSISAPPAKKKTGWIIAIVGIAVVAISLCAGAFVFGQNLFNQFFPSSTTAIENIDDNNSVIPVKDTSTPEPKEDSIINPDDNLTTTPENSQPTDTLTPTETPTPTESPPPSVNITDGSLGTSIQGRELAFTNIGYENGKVAIVVVGGIQGDQPTTRDLVNAIINDLKQNPEKVPSDTRITLIPIINPDGLAMGSRYNAQSVDLNRNWDTADWKSNAAVPGYPDGKPGAGGMQPFSEPETRALRDYLNNLQANVSSLRILILHSSVRISSGQIYPGGNSALGLSNAYANATGYAIEQSWAAYVTSGEAVTWCEEQGMMAIDVVMPAAHDSTTIINGNRTLLDITIDGLINMAVN